MKFPLTLLYIFWLQTAFAQPDSVAFKTTAQNHQKATSNIRLSNFIVPAALITYGVVAVENDGLKHLNFITKEEIREHNPFFKNRLDNYAQFLPAAVTFSLNALGIKGEHTVKQQALLYSGIMVLNTGVVFPLKKITAVMRPDSSSATSFPSGHTSTAFASAEFLRREYGKQYPWLAVAGYAVAAGTGVYRMLNNKHWLSDVAAGAGIGIASTNIVYWLYGKVNHKSIMPDGAFLFPTYQNHQIGLMFSKTF
ncbi:MAG: phosphatase PAP2 family protein [Verrucomicrobia bacterium]|nr:phosphatase PAP2 family protein [Verrucomicrobiota bacterium]